jgi:hypothetical protein
LYSTQYGSKRKEKNAVFVVSMISAKQGFFVCFGATMVLFSILYLYPAIREPGRRQYYQRTATYAIIGIPLILTWISE